MGIRDEFEFIKRISPKGQTRNDIIVGIGDDAAIVRPKLNTDMIACTDTMVEEIHFNKKTMSPYHIGYKALASNISDIAAMGGEPVHYLVSMIIPSHWEEDELVQIYDGMDDLSKEYQMELIGGDTVSTKGPLVINVTVLGQIEKGRSLRRDSANPGDVIFITGTVGDSAAGLHILLNEKADNELHKDLILKHQLPIPQVEAGRILSNFDRVSANDISDGVASEAKEIAEASGVDLYLEEDELPLSKGILTFGKEQAIKWALFGGEDYELIGTCSLQEWQGITQAFKQQDISIKRVGTVKEGTGNVFLKTEKELLELHKQGFNHFRTR